MRGKRKRRRSNNNGALAALEEPELADFWGGLRSFMIFSTCPQWALCKHPVVTVSVSCIYCFVNTIL